MYAREGRPARRRRWLPGLLYSFLLSLRRSWNAGRDDGSFPRPEPGGQAAARLARLRQHPPTSAQPGSAEPNPDPAEAPRHTERELACALELLSPVLSAHDPDLSQLRASPLGQALTRHLHARYPNLEEYQDLILAELVESTRDDDGQRALAEDPSAMVELAVRRAMVCLAEVRVALRRAVRCELVAMGARPPGDPAQAMGDVSPAPAAKPPPHAS